MPLLLRRDALWVIACLRVNKGENDGAEAFLTRERISNDEGSASDLQTLLRKSRAKTLMEERQGISG
jgi:hypothetical protein